MKTEEEIKLEKLFELEQQLDIPYCDRWYNKDFDKRESEAEPARTTTKEQSIIANVSVSLPDPYDICKCCAHPQKYCICSNER